MEPVLGVLHNNQLSIICILCCFCSLVIILNPITLLFDVVHLKIIIRSVAVETFPYATFSFCGRKRVMAATKHRTLDIAFNTIGIGVEGKAKPNAAQIAKTRNMADRE